MKIAVIGAGLCGLAVSYYLLEAGCSVDLFDEKGVGGGASGIACGLIHPYPGEESKRSWRADEALHASHELFAKAGEFPHKEIVRVGRTEEEREALRKALLLHDDVEEREGVFIIKSGMTVNVSSYLQKLWALCKSKGAHLHFERIQNLELLAAYDQIVIAAGAGTPFFSECKELNVQKLKGQLLLCSYPAGFSPLERSLIGKGYVALGENKDECVLGSTYERSFTTEAPDIKKAKEEILPKVTTFFPRAGDLVIKECRAAVRLMRRGHYLPYVRKVGKKNWVCTAMGSRGLLYHAFAGKMLARAIIANDETKILPELT